MKEKSIKAVFAVLCTLALFTVNQTPVAATMLSDTETGTPYVEGEILVVPEENTANPAMVSLLEESDYAVAADMEGDTNTVDYVVVELTEDMQVEEAVKYYENIPGVAYAQPNYIYELEESSSKTTAVDDPFYTNQWYLEAIHVPEAWSLLKGQEQKEVLVAILDTGIDLNHPDLNANIDEAHCVNSASEELPNISNDFTGHGTHIAGEIAAVFDNGTGITGISNNYAKIAAIQCSNGSVITTKSVERGIRYAISMGAQVLNMSLGTSADDMLLREALEDAYDANILTVCSAGNDGTDAKHYPSAYDTTIGVIATDKEGLKRSSGSYGTDNFISAPGEGMYSTIPTNSYGNKNGSSMSAGVVTGVVSLMLSLDDTLTPEEIKELLAKTATDTYEKGFDAYSGHGIVDVEAVVKEILKRTDASQQEPADEPEKDKEEIELPEYLKNPNTTDSFVKRLYYYSLGREADEAGLKDWTNRLNSGAEHGGQVAMGFLFSDEFLNKQVSNEDYVNLLYRIFLGREGDTAGKAYWMSKLSMGMSRLYVVNGFSGSEEFTLLCNKCGIQSGQVISGEYRDRNEGVTGFVVRLYDKALGRTYEVDGVNYWCEKIIRKQMSPKDIATVGFFHSREFTNRKLSDGEFVKVLYRTFLNRECDEAGYKDWCNRLKNGTSRDEVIRGFGDSQEFANLMKAYGL